MKLNIYYDPIVSINKVFGCRYCYSNTKDTFQVIRHNLEVSTSSRVVKEVPVLKCSKCEKLYFSVTLQLYALRLYRGNTT